jgi:hypothetical protein
MKQKTFIIASASILLLILCMTTDPKNAPSVVLIIPFILLLIILTVGIQLLLRYKKWPRSKIWRVSFGAACVPLALLILQSIGQLTLRDALTLIAFFFLAYFYAGRMAKAKV